MNAELVNVVTRHGIDMVVLITSDPAEPTLDERPEAVGDGVAGRRRMDRDHDRSLTLGRHHPAECRRHGRHVPDPRASRPSAGRAVTQAASAACESTCGLTVMGGAFKSRGEA